jgi:thiol-disulfide isomerase/thioredoxin
MLVAACGSDAPGGQAEGGNVAAAPDASRSVVGLDRSHSGTLAPDLEFQPATLADFRGKPLLLNLWATWCAPCVKELPTLDALAAREGERLQVVTLSQDMDGREKVEAFLAQGKFGRLEGWLDPEMKMMGALGVSTLPTTILYDAEGREIWRMVGDQDWAGREAAALIAEASRP